MILAKRHARYTAALFVKRYKLCLERFFPFKLILENSFEIHLGIFKATQLEVYFLIMQKSK